LPSVSRSTSFSLAPNLLKSAKFTRREFRAATFAGGRTHGPPTTGALIPTSGAAAVTAGGLACVARGSITAGIDEAVRCLETITMLTTIRIMMNAPTPICRLVIVIP
jgi:hypothetical protein